MRSAFTALISLFLLAVTTSMSPAHAAGNDVSVMVIIHPDNTVKVEDYDNQSIKKIFLKQSTTWPDTDKTKIEPYQLASGTDEAAVFRKQVLGMDTKELSKYWSDKKADDGDSEPITKKTSDEVYKLVIKDKGAIGFISKSYFDGLTEEQKKAVKELRTVNNQ